MKKCENPLIPEITKSHKERQFNLGDLKLPEGLRKVCVWCLERLKGGQRRWCGPACQDSAQAWGYPQKEHGLGELLIRQGFKCNICAFDYGTVVEKLFEAPRIAYGIGPAHETWRTEPNVWLTYRLKEHLHAHDLPHRLEVDHILAISKGGQSLGLDNHQAICYTCHKEKTKKDLSGKRKKEIE